MDKVAFHSHLRDTECSWTHDDGMWRSGVVWYGTSIRVSSVTLRMTSLYTLFHRMKNSPMNGGGGGGSRGDPKRETCHFISYYDVSFIVSISFYYQMKNLHYSRRVTCYSLLPATCSPLHVPWLLFSLLIWQVWWKNEDRERGRIEMRYSTKT
jgi:hypothetical protein